jgi:lysylphosphatidylglycerol synthetase-like protein (DUF2156 family)
MTKSEVSGYVQIVIGAIGIVVTILTAPAMLDAIGQIGGPSGLPPEFAGVSGAVRIFSVLFVLFAFAMLLMLGLALVMVPVFRSLGSAHPFLTGFFTVATVVSLAMTATLAALGINYWIAGFVASLSLIWMTFATLEKDKEDEEYGGIAVVATVGSIIFLFVGGITAMGNAASNNSPAKAETSAASPAD